MTATWRCEQHPDLTPGERFPSDGGGPYCLACSSGRQTTDADGYVHPADCRCRACPAGREATPCADCYFDAPNHAEECPNWAPGREATEPCRLDPPCILCRETT